MRAAVALASLATVPSGSATALGAWIAAAPTPPVSATVGAPKPTPSVEVATLIAAPSPAS